MGPSHLLLCTYQLALHILELNFITNLHILGFDFLWNKFQHLKKQPSVWWAALSGFCFPGGIRWADPRNGPCKQVVVNIVIVIVIVIVFVIELSLVTVPARVRCEHCQNTFAFWGVFPHIPVPEQQVIVDVHRAEGKKSDHFAQQVIHPFTNQLNSYNANIPQTRGKSPLIGAE